MYIAKARLIELQTPYLASYRETSIKKKSFKLKILKIFYCLQLYLSKTSLFGLNLGFKPNLSLFH